MNFVQKTNILSRLGKILAAVGNKEEWSGYDLGINEDEYNQLLELVEKVHIYNGWFTPEAVRESFLGIASWLEEEKLEQWVKAYPTERSDPKTVALVMAGNIPLVGFHDFLAVLMSGNKALVKCSSQDQHLFPAIVKLMSFFDPEINDRIRFADGPLTDFDAVIATGSDNSAQYFESYFGKYPHIIRKNRTSVAVLSGNESDEELKELGNDIFTFYGLGCRNVSKLLIPEDYDLNKFFEAIYEYNPIINHNKYANNYDYNKAVYLMNKEELLDNGFLLLKEDDQLHSPLGVLFYSRYKDKEEVISYFKDYDQKIQAIIGEGFIPFGQAQRPDLTDYADGVDTMRFLVGL